MPISTTLAATALAGLALLPSASAATYKLAEKSQGSTFFNAWTFDTQADLTTNGDVQYQANSSLAYVDSTTGNAIMKMSTDEVLYPNKRNSIRIEGKSTWGVGSVFVMDALHVPQACGVWPAFFTTVDSTVWPVGGEIDVLEAVNLQQTNSFAMHTAPGCVPAVNSSQMTSQIQESYIACNDAGNVGCKQVSSDTNTFGTGFNAAGGGVYIAELAESGVSIWFYTRASIPSAVNKDMTSIDTSSLGTPIAFWPSQGCSPISKYIYNQRPIIDITACGDYAGSAAIMNSTGCTISGNTNSNACYATYVLDAANFGNAYWEIAYLSIFSNNASTANTASVSGSSSSTRVSPSASAAASGSSGTSSAPATLSAGSRWSALAAVVGGALAFVL